MKPPKNELRIACYIHDRESYGYSVLRGIADWSRTQTNCRVINYQLMSQLPLTNPHGVIAQLGHPQSIPPALSLRPLPILNVSAAQADIPFPTVTTDNPAVGRSGALHLLNTGLSHFAFARYPWTEYGRLREAGFQDEIGKHEGTLLPSYVRPKTEKDMTEGLPFPPSMPAWLQSLPLPCGIMTDCEDMARAITFCASSLNLRIPDDLALISADKEHGLTELMDPPLSCVPLPGRTVGWRAAELLANHVRNGEALPEAPCLIPPEPIVVRQSSDLMYVNDDAVRRAIAFIRANAHERISIPNVASAVGMNRRTLEIRFKTLLRRTILETIQQTHLQEALRLLRETHLNMTDVCYQSGFPNPQRFNETIKAETGLTPLAYRKKFQPG